MNLKELRESLYLKPRHICCDEAKYYLFPPNGSTLGPVILDVGIGSVRAINYWHIDVGDGSKLIPVKFCPFCGQALTELKQPSN